MKAAWFETFGSPKDSVIVGDLPKPTLSSRQVLVRIQTSGVNPSDVKKRAGAFPNLLEEGLVIPHSDGAGVVEQVGEEVSQDRVGERVWVYQAQYGRRFGTSAEYITIDERRAVALPDNVSFEVGACLGIPAMTAHRCVFADGPVDGQTILVTGGAGRVGYYAIQWAKSSGASVIATASNSRDADACRDAGADEVINHREPNWGDSALSLTNGQEVDRVIDVEFGANLSEVLKLVRTGATIATYSSTQVKEPQLPFLRMMYMDLTIRMVIVYAMPEEAKKQAADDINRFLAEDRLKHRIAEIVPLAETARAHEIIEQGDVRGCVVVDVVS